MLRLHGIVVACAAAALAAAALACGAASGGASQSGFVNGDSGTEFDAPLEDGTASGDSGVSVGDGGTEASLDAGADAGTGAEFVHASPDLPDLRLCWKVDGGGFSGVDDAFPSGTPAPASNYAALPVGGAAALADASSLVGSNLTIVGIPANFLSGWEMVPGHSPNCADLLGGGGQSLLGDVTVYTFTVPAGIVAGATDVIALAGCPADDPNGSVARCGAGYTPATGNLHVDVLPLYQVTQSDAGQLPVQTAQLSPALAQLAGDAGAVAVSFGPQGATTPVATLGYEGAFAPTSAAYLNVGANPSNYGSLGFAVDVVGTDGGPGHLWMSLEQSLELVDPMMNPAVYYTQVDTYVVAIVGDPNGVHAFAPDASFDGTGLHVLVFPL